MHPVFRFAVKAAIWAALFPIAYSLGGLEHRLFHAVSAEWARGYWEAWAAAAVWPRAIAPWAFRFGTERR